jgi:hypothetical protein
VRAEVDVDQRDVRRQLGGVPQRLVAAGRHGDHVQPFAFQQATGSRQEPGTVVDDQATQRHGTSMATTPAARHSG